MARRSLTVSKATSAIDKNGVLLVYPIKNLPEPKSLWSELLPGKTMRWEWTASAQNEVVQMWQLREQLSRSPKVVYAKWFQKRATFMSLPFAERVLCVTRNEQIGLSENGKKIISALELNSPQTLKSLKKYFKKELEALQIERALAELWRKLFIVGRGEIDDGGAFASLAIEPTSYPYEKNWAKSEKLSPVESLDWLLTHTSAQPSIQKWIRKNYLLNGKLSLSAKEKIKPNVIYYENL